MGLNGGGGGGSEMSADKKAREERWEKERLEWEKPPFQMRGEREGKVVDMDARFVPKDLLEVLTKEPLGTQELEDPQFKRLLGVCRRQQAYADGKPQGLMGASMQISMARQLPTSKREFADYLEKMIDKRG